MNKICQNCKYHYIEEISFDYPQSCCNRTNPHYTTEAGLHCNNFEYSEEYMKKQLEAYENMRKEVIDYVEEKGRLKYNPQDLLNILNKVGENNE